MNVARRRDWGAVRSRRNSWQGSNDFSPLDNDVIQRHIAMKAFFAGFHRFDAIDDVVPGDHLPEHAVPPALAAWFAVVEKRSVVDVDEDL